MENFLRVSCSRMPKTQLFKGDPIRLRKHHAGAFEVFTLTVITVGMPAATLAAKLIKLGVR